MCRQIQKFTCGHKHIERVKCVERVVATPEKDASLNKSQGPAAAAASPRSCDRVLAEGYRKKACDACLGHMARLMRSPKGAGCDSNRPTPARQREGGRVQMYVSSWVEEQAWMNPAQVGRDQPLPIKPVKAAVHEVPRPPTARPSDEPEVINVVPHHAVKGRQETDHLMKKGPVVYTADRQTDLEPQPQPQPERSARKTPPLMAEVLQRERFWNPHRIQRGRVHRGREASNFSTFKNPRPAPRPPVIEAPSPRAVPSEEQKQQRRPTQNEGFSQRQPSHLACSKTIDDDNTKGLPTTSADSFPVKALRRVTKAKVGELKLGRAQSPHQKVDRVRATPTPGTNDGFFSRLFPGRRRNSTSTMPPAAPPPTKRPSRTKRPSTSGSLRESLRRVGTNIRVPSPFEWRRPEVEDESFACVTAREQTRAGMQARLDTERPNDGMALLR